MAGIEELSEAIDQWMTVLSSRRPVFHSEFDFQFALCDVIARAGVTRIRLERMVQLPDSPRFEVDIMGCLNGLPMALELKYPKKRFLGKVSTDGYDELFNLPSSGADDLDAHAIWKDAARIEKLMAAEIVEAGAVIALSNFEFWDQRKHRQGTQAYDFRLWQGRELEAGTVLNFTEPKGAHSPVELRYSYLCDWHPYSDPLASDFRYLVLAPGSHD
ncbi:hypothetical protein [Mycobacterium sp. E3251]|uniref:hypothetical protein n=1 Tax=Mycobacterium sp. E3251 TaxID=1834144 RepID=UPI0012E7F905|nr:hypothetical protein [Mycobacterium sp. E3251]